MLDFFDTITLLAPERGYDINLSIVRQSSDLEIELTIGDYSENWHVMIVKIHSGEVSLGKIINDMHEEIIRKIKGNG